MKDSNIAASRCDHWKIICLLTPLGFLVCGGIAMCCLYKPGERIDALGYWIIAIMWTPSIISALVVLFWLLTFFIPAPKAFRDRSVIYEHHPTLGVYIYEPTIDAWMQGRTTVDKKAFLLRGRGRSPSNDQLGLWSQIEAQLSELIKVAIEAVPEPPRSEFRAKFLKTDLVLAEVRIERDLTIYLFFSSPIEDEIELAPMVVFSDWIVTAAEWVC
jgi:hypothetical protein